MQHNVFVCEDTLEGIFTGIWHAWPQRHEAYRDKVVAGTAYTMELFAEYIPVSTDRRKAEKVLKMIQKNLGPANYEDLFCAAMSQDERKADAIFGTVIEAAKIPDSRQIMNHLSNDSVRTVFELSRTVGNEVHHYRMFIRFRELRNGILFAEITPNNNVLPLIMDHFENRFPLENWAVYDHSRGEFLIHQKERPCMIVSGEPLNIEETERYSEEEEHLEDMFRQFVKSISIKERENYKLQRQNMPLRFREHMTEFEEKKN